MAGSPSSSALSAGRLGQPAVWRSDNRPDAAGRASTSALVYLFILSLALPVIFYAGPLRLSPYRLILLALFVPCLVAWLSGQLGRVRLPDVLIVMACIWATLALTIIHGPAIAWQPSGILLIETFGAYLLARKLIRNQHAFRTMVRVLFWTICVLLPFAAFEFLTGRAVLIEMLDGVATVISTTEKSRFGWHRAQVAFEHPILYGVFCASAIGLAYFVIGFPRSTLGRMLCVVPVTLAAMFSLSAGAAASIVAQFGLTSWDYVMARSRSRWSLFALLALAAYVSVDLISNRTPFHVFVTYLTFSAETGYSRIMIWNWGIAEVMRHPIFGIGLAEWERPVWKSASMDNFWLVIAVRYGVPAFLMLAGAVVLIMRTLAKTEIRDGRLRACRAGLLITLAGLVIAGCTVHYWNAIYVWFMFLLGSGAWMLDEASGNKSVDGSRERAERRGVLRQRTHETAKTADPTAGHGGAVATRRLRRPPIRMS
ncbi:MAG: O-antigen ligase family protein [bacterium]